MSFEFKENLHRGKEKDTHKHTRTHALLQKLLLALVSGVWQGNTEAATFPRKHRREQSADMSAGSDASKSPRTLPSSSQCAPTVCIHTRARTKTTTNTINVCFFFTKKKESAALETPVQNLMNLRRRRLQFPVSFAASPPFPILSRGQLIKELSPEIIQTGAAKVSRVLLRQDYQFEQ